MGEDVTEGNVAITAGIRLNPHHLGLLAALGETDVSVVRKPKVAILATGNELVELGNKLEPGKIVETNRLVFSSHVHGVGRGVTKLGCSQGRPERDNFQNSGRLRAGRCGHHNWGDQCRLS